MCFEELKSEYKKIMNRFTIEIPLTQFDLSNASCIFLSTLTDAVQFLGQMGRNSSKFVLSHNIILYG